MVNDINHCTVLPAIILEKENDYLRFREVVTQPLMQQDPSLKKNYFGL